MKRLATRAVVIVVGLTLFFAAGTGAAWAYWTATASGSGATSSDAFPGTSAAKPNASVAGTTVTLSFNGVETTGSRAASAYAITRYDSTGSNPQIVASASCSIAATVTCTLAGVPLGAWRYSYRPRLGTNWLGSESSLSDQSTVGATKLVFTTAPRAGTASLTAAIGPMTVQQRDASDTAIVATSDVTVSLGSTSAGTTIFGTTSNATTGVTAVTIPAGSSSATFYYGDTKLSSPSLTITASSSGLTSATQSVTVSAAAPDRIAFAAAPASGTAASSPTIGAFTVEQEDQFGNPASSTSAIALNLSTTATNTGTFSATSGGTTTTSVSIAANSSSASFYYGDTKAGSPTITVGTANWTSIGKTVVVRGAAPASIALAACAFNNLSTACSAPFALGNNGILTAYVQAFDQWGNPATISTPMILSVTSQNPTNYSVTPSSLTIDGTGSPANQTTTSFTVTKNGTPNNSTTITISAGGSPADLMFGVKKQ